jgi:hypothetical protein
VAVTAGASRGAKGEGGFADVWWRDKFAWEYKRKGKYRDLTDACRSGRRQLNCCLVSLIIGLVVKPDDIMMFR